MITSISRLNAAIPVSPQSTHSSTRNAGRSPWRTTARQTSAATAPTATTVQSSATAPRMTPSWNSGIPLRAQARPKAP
ncbi:hypothetical protein [Kitasatospora kifunensis]|uniref:Uncharacterized protein n=1 Tax=Kitasatospora kifunensis TaxID=58351 RepID=A0A7W7RB72_KITKI|nr:hypothetical protein [Kitasatospora kifunensis]MBB4928478.1 hypothetical protein [Kitasatospora kifunensis]